MVDNITTIKISKKTKDRLKNLQVYKNETYEEIITKVLEMLNLLKISPQQAIERLAQTDTLRKQHLERQK